MADTTDQSFSDADTSAVDDLSSPASLPDHDADFDSRWRDAVDVEAFFGADVEQGEPPAPTSVPIVLQLLCQGGVAAGGGASDVEAVQNFECSGDPVTVEQSWELSDSSQASQCEEAPEATADVVDRMDTHMALMEDAPVSPSTSSCVPVESGPKSAGTSSCPSTWVRGASDLEAASSVGDGDQVEAAEAEAAEGAWSLSSDGETSDDEMQAPRSQSRSRSPRRSAAVAPTPPQRALPPPPKIAGIEYWQHPLYEACKSWRSALCQVFADKLCSVDLTRYQPSVFPKAV